MARQLAWLTLCEIQTGRRHGSREANLLRNGCPAVRILGPGKARTQFINVRWAAAATRPLMLAFDLSSMHNAESAFPKENSYIPQEASVSIQTSWRYCQNCEALFYSGYPGQGVCPAANGGPHLAQGFDFTLPFNDQQTPNAQASWMFCQKCDAMFYTGYADKTGVCVAGGGHSQQGANFVLPHDVPVTLDSQADWRFCQKCFVMFYSGFASQGKCAAGGQHSAQGFNFVLPFGASAPIPARGLGSNSNYILDCSCNQIQTLTIVIAITEDLVGGDGWSFQLNAYSSLGQFVAWQQYGIILGPWGPPQPPLLAAFANNWASLIDPVLNIWETLGEAPNYRLPAGYSIIIELNFNNSEGNHNVVGAQYNLIDNNGKDVASTSIDLTYLPPGVSPTIAPIIAFELNLVGPFNSIQTEFTSGAGTITYIGSPDFRVLDTTPPCSDTRMFTAETGNSFYGPLPAAGGGVLIQTFNYSGTVPMIREVGNTRPPLIYNGVHVKPGTV